MEKWQEMIIDWLNRKGCVKVGDTYQIILTDPCDFDISKDVVCDIWNGKAYSGRDRMKTMIDLAQENYFEDYILRQIYDLVDGIAPEDCYGEYEEEDEVYRFANEIVEAKVHLPNFFMFVAELISQEETA